MSLEYERVTKQYTLLAFHLKLSNFTLFISFQVSVDFTMTMNSDWPTWPIIFKLTCNTLRCYEIVKLFLSHNNVKLSFRNRKRQKIFVYIQNQKTLLKYINIRVKARNAQFKKQYFVTVYLPYVK